MSLLIVEDDPSMQFMLREWLKRKDIAFRLADDGPGALELARQELPSVVLLDMTLPEMGGIQVWDKMIALADGRAVRVIPFTAKLDSGLEAEIRKRSPFEVLHKPVDPNRMIQVLRSALQNDTAANPDC